MGRTYARRYQGCSVLLALLASISLLSGHVVEQLYAELRNEEAHWEIEVLFDAGYADAETRGDPDSPPPTRDWLVALSREEQVRLCEGAAAYLRECLQFSAQGVACEVGYRYLDLEQDPPEFVRLLNDGAYLRVLITPVVETEEVECSVASGKIPDFVFKVPGEGDDGYLTLKPGESLVFGLGWAKRFDDAITSTSTEVVTSSAVGFLFRQGFLHVLPFGLDHLLFVLALFLLQRKWKDLLWQLLAFTAAHTLTLGLTAADLVAPRGSWVEPLVALSIVALAVENLFSKKLSRGRLALVFGFGLIHGMAFANALSPLLGSGEGFLSRLLAANLGVECAQIAVLGLAWIATLRWCERARYEQFRKGGNMVLVLVAGVWFIQRILPSFGGG